MENISKLLKEAKPLYFVKKKRKQRFIASLATIICVFGFSFLYPSVQEVKTYNYEYVFLDNIDYDNISIIEDMGLPTDEYGLLSVV